MNENIFVSIVIPAYNAEKYIERCVKSLIYQTLEEIQIIIVNDGSTDNTGKLIDKIAAQDKRISVVHKKNGGVSSARNAGIRHAKGQYIGFIDSDDYVDKFMYEKLYNLAKKNDADIVVCGKIIEYSTGKKSIEYPSLPIDTFIENQTKVDLVYKQFVYMDDRFSSVFTKIYKTSLILQNNILFDETININEDWFFNINTFTSAKKIVSTNKAYIHYMVENMTSLSRRYRRDFDKVFYKKYSILKNHLVKWNINDNVSLGRLNASYCNFIAFTIINIFDKRNEDKLMKKFKDARKILNAEVVEYAAENANISECKATHRFKIWCIKKKNVFLLGLWAKVYFQYLRIRGMGLE